MSDYLAIRTFPDGRIATVYMLIGGRARLTVGWDLCTVADSF